MSSKSRVSGHLHPFRDNEPRRRRWIKTETQLKEIKLPVSEIFQSIQGEGVSAGTTAVFLRTYYCNLSCTWCDTKYTWENQVNAKEGAEYRRSNLEEIIRRIKSYGCNRIVITGGEPLLHNAPLGLLTQSLKHEGFFIEVETNGTIEPCSLLIESADQFNVSPKLTNSSVAKYARIKPRVIDAFTHSGKAWFKFVICEPRDVDEAEALISELAIPKSRVLLMPEATSPKVLAERSIWLATECKTRGFRLSPRLHIWLYGNERGR